MVTQRCPRCASGRVRRGYRPTPIWSKVFFRYNLLCDNCNWEFKGFGVPGTVSTKPTKKPKKAHNESAARSVETRSDGNRAETGENTEERFDSTNSEAESGAPAKKKELRSNFEQ